MARTSHHLSQDLQGALSNWHDSKWYKVATKEDGSYYSPDEIKAYFLSCLAEGKRVIPFGDCDNFDFQKGCLGHAPEEKLTIRKTEYDNLKEKLTMVEAELEALKTEEVPQASLVEGEGLNGALTQAVDVVGQAVGAVGQAVGAVGQAVDALKDLADSCIATIAEACHKANRSYCQMIGDDSQVPWEEAPQWQKDSAIKGVMAYVGGEAKSPEEQHQCWLDDKLADGWVYGAEKNVELKTHPCCVPYAELPAEQRVKDIIFRAVVSAFTKA